MDGPNTSWNVLTMLHDDRCEKDYLKVIDIGSCSLLVLHDVFTPGVEATDWFLNKILKAMWKIFDDSLARRDTCIKICEVDKFSGIFILEVIILHSFYIPFPLLSLRAKGFRHPNITTLPLTGGSEFFCQERGAVNLESRLRGFNPSRNVLALKVSLQASEDVLVLS